MGQEVGRNDLAAKLTMYLAQNRPKKALSDEHGVINQAHFNLIFDELKKREEALDLGLNRLVEPRGPLRGKARVP